MPESYEELFQRASAHYESISALPIPALGGDLVHFTRIGLNHLLRKGRKLRSLEDRSRRLRLLEYVEETLQYAESHVRYRVSKTSQQKTITYWEFSRKFDSRIVKVIVSQIDRGPKIFLSIMDLK